MWLWWAAAQQAISGTTLIDNPSEISTATDNVIDKARKNCPGTPERRPRGAKTTTAVSVEPTSGAMSYETAPDLSRDVELAAGKGACSRDGVTRAAVPGSVRLEQGQHVLRAVRRPRRDDPPVSFAQCLG